MAVDEMPKMVTLSASPAERASRVPFLFADSVYRVPKLPIEAKIKYSISKCNRVLEFDDF